MKFFVNFLSAFRIAASFAIIPTLLFGWWWISFILFVLGAMSDWFDGFLARKYNVCTKLGGVMDHIGDKLIVVNTFIMLAIMFRGWLMIVPIVLMIARELYISGLREFLGTQKIEMPVPKARFSMGKIKTTLQMITIAALLLSVTLQSSQSEYWFTFRLIGIFGVWFSLVASLWSATEYTFTFIQKLKKIK